MLSKLRFVSRMRFESKVTAVLLFAAGMVGMPILSLAGEDEVNFLASHELPTQECQNSTTFRDLCGTDVALVRGLSKSSADHLVPWHAADYKAYKEDRNPPVTFKVSEDTDNIQVSITLPKQYLLTVLPENGLSSDPLQVLSVDVIGKSGNNTCSAYPVGSAAYNIL